MNSDNQKLTNNSKDKQIASGKEAELLDLLRSALTVGIGILDEDMNYQFISDSLYQQLGISPDELQIGDNVDICHALMIQNGLIDQDFLEQAELSGKSKKKRLGTDSKDRSMLVTLKDGCTHRFARKDMGNGYTVSMADDVSEIIEKDVLLEDALRLGQSGYWFLDIHTQEYYLSDSLKAYFSDDDKTRIRDHGMIGIVHPDDTGHFWRSLSEMDASDPVVNVTVRLVDRDGEKRYHEVTFQLLQDQHGQWNKVRAFTRDKTVFHTQNLALEKAKNEAIAASEAKSQFLANMSHEIRTPLNGVMGMTELLSRTSIDANQKDFLDIITQSATQLLMIINDILDFSRVEAGEMRMDSSSLNLKTTIDDVVGLVSPLARQKDLELIINYPQNTPLQFIGDEGRIRQILTNLLGNAIKFTEEGYIRVDVSLKPGTEETGIIQIDVVDTGIGIPDEKLAKVFGKFTQVDNSSTRVHGGTGLGLSISQSLVELMGGSIKASSTLGTGSTFSVVIPLPYDQVTETPAANLSDLKGKHVLVVDDIEINRRILTEMLSEWGMGVVTAADAFEALKILKNPPPGRTGFDAIITDHVMPGMNGQELAAAISVSGTMAGSPVIMLSSCDRIISDADLRSLGIDAYLVKPVRSERLRDTLSKHLKNKAPKSIVPPPFPEKAYDDSLVARAHRVPEPEEQDIREILVAEDIRLNQDVVRFMLEGTAFDPIFVENGQEALELYCTAPDRFDGILMDISMPVMDGIQATQHIHTFEAKHKLPKTPIIALTGHALKDDRKKCLRAGLDDYLSKPIKRADLLQMLDKWTAEADLQKETSAA